MTTKPTHTPGPWEIGKRLQEDVIYIHSSGNKKEYGRSIVDVKNLDKDLLSEDEANARLISLAPELLAELRDVIDHDNYISSLPSIQRERIKALIAKAIGE